MDGDGPLIECPICWNGVSLENVLSLKCGHCFCTDCLSRHIQARTRRAPITCPTCREPMSPERDPRQVFFSLHADPNPRSPKRRRISAGTIDLTAHDSGPSSDSGQRHAQQIQEFQARIQKLETKLATARNAASDLRNEVQGLTASLESEKRRRVSEMESLKEKLDEKDRQVLLARQRQKESADEAKRATARASKAEQDRASTLVDLQSKDEELKTWQTRVTTFKLDEKKWKAKHKDSEKEVQELKDEVAKLRGQLTAPPSAALPDESLMVEAPDYSQILGGVFNNQSDVDDPFGMAFGWEGGELEKTQIAEHSDSEDELNISSSSQPRPPSSQRLSSPGPAALENRPLPDDRRQPRPVNFQSDWNLPNAAPHDRVKKRKHQEDGELVLGGGPGTKGTIQKVSMTKSSSSKAKQNAKKTESRATKVTSRDSKENKQTTLPFLGLTDSKGKPSRSLVVGSRAPIRAHADVRRT